jgi:hypothetical protein
VILYSRSCLFLVHVLLHCAFVCVFFLSVRKMDPGPFGSKGLVFDDQHNMWTNMFASVCVCSSHDAKRIGLRH